MNLAKFLFKPKWQDKDASVRRASVSSAADPSLLAALPEIARNDVDSGVRLAALRRLDDYECWRACSTADVDADIRRRARNEYMTRLCSKTEGVPTLRRRIAELDTLSPAEIDHVATTAIDRELRVAALGRVSRMALLAERAVLDPDPELRLAVLELITDPTILERVAERARKTDKAVSRSARARLEAMQIAEGDAATINDTARMLCDRIETLMRSPGTNVADQFADIEIRWNALGKLIEPGIAARFDGTRQLMRAMLAPKPVIALAIEESATTNESTQPSVYETGASDEVPIDAPLALAAIAAEDAADSLASRARFDAALAAAEAGAKREQLARQAAMSQIELAIPEFRAAVEAGDVTGALELRARIDTLAVAAGGTRGTTEKQLQPLDARLAQLRQWVHWSNQNRRQALCDEIEALGLQGAHPDALANRIRDAREEWRQLEVSGGAMHSGRDSSLTRRFNALCQKVLKPAQGYFDKRGELRDAHHQRLNELLTRVGALASDSVDIKQMSELRLELGAALRKLDDVDPRERTQLARRLKAGIAALVPRIEAQEGNAQSARARLIERAVALTNASDRHQPLPRQVRELQKLWTAVGPGKRATDQRQWREFRAACDAAFGKLDAERGEHEAKTSAALELSKSLVEAYEALAGDDQAHADDTRKLLRELDAQWQSQASNERALEQRQRKAIERISARLSVLARTQHLGKFNDALRAYTMIVTAPEAPSDENERRWQTLPQLTSAFASILRSRFEKSKSNDLTAADAVGLDEARDLLVKLEFIGGTATPPDERQRRMDYQVQRLSAHLRGGASASNAEAELTGVLQQWFQLPYRLPADLDARFSAAAQAAVNALP